MIAIRSTCLAVAAFFFTMAGGLAQENFVANLTPGQEVTAPTFTMSSGGARPASFGDATLVLSADLTQLTMTINIFNIDVNGSQTPGDTNDNLAAAHIHSPGAPGANASVVWGFVGMPFHNTDMDLTITPFVGQVGGTFTVIWDSGEASGGLAAHLNSIRNGTAYLNFHTVQNGGGEIRGQILVPEPSTVALLSIGAIGAAVGVWKRRRTSR